MIAQAFGQQVAEFPDTLSFPLLVAGFTTLCFDGQNFFDTDHPMAGGTYSNIVGDIATDKGESWFLIDESQVLKPILTRSAALFNRALDDLSSEHTFKNNEFLYGVDGRCNVGFGFWQTASGPAHR